MKINARQEGVVIEHLFKVRYKPLSIDGVTVKAAAELVVHSAFGYLAACMLNHFERFNRAVAVMQVHEKLECHRGRKFWRASKTPILPIIVGREPAKGGIEEICCEHLARWP